MPRPAARRDPPALQNGDELDAEEFLRRYRRLPEGVKAELVAGIVHKAPPISLDHHAEPDSLLQTVLGTDAAHTRGVRAATNATVRLGRWDTPQPDALLRIVPQAGGKTRVDEDGYLVGPPELVVEISASSVSIDARRKKQSYLEAGVQEYIVWRTHDAAVDWWQHVDGSYEPLPVEGDGCVRSRAFPGLWLHIASLLGDDSPQVLAKLHEGIASAEHAAFAAGLASR